MEPQKFQPASVDGIPGCSAHIGLRELAEIQDYVAHAKGTGIDNDENVPNSAIYSRLGPNQIRVLELLPGTFEADLFGALHAVDVGFQYQQRIDPKNGLLFQWKINHAISVANKAPFWYTALSYVWGPPDFEVKFTFPNGSSVLITKSLTCGLRHLRSEVESVFLWIDQICINQADIKDKEQQIPLMGAVYGHATNTVMWLGDEEGDGPAIAFDTLALAHSRLQTLEEIAVADLARLDLPPLDSREWREVKLLFDRPWFQRLWVIQEAMLSNTLHVKVGKLSTAWETFSHWCGSLQSSGIQSWIEADSEPDAQMLDDQTALVAVPSLPSGCTTVNRIDTSRSFNQTSPQRLPLLDCLVTISPRYSDAVSAREVYLEACLQQLSRGPDWTQPILCSVDHETPLKPSWVPDWSKARRTESLGYSTMIRHVYQAGRLASGTPIMDYRLEDERNTMILHGKLFDTIASIGCISTRPVLDIDAPTEKNRQWISYIDMARSRNEYPTGETIWDAFWQTLVAGKDGSSTAKAPSDYSEVLGLIVDESTGLFLTVPGQTCSPRRKKGFFTLDNLRSRKPRETLEDARKSFRAALRNRRFAVTERGYFALVPRGAKAGDAVCVFEGGYVPFIVRLTGSGSDYELVGESYVHGIMQGQAMSMSDISLVPIRLV
ncbi:HET-domain-containing protein [Amniculicola lignicola CBS 123094]|uniref:HET-domain-containing protein n=1 Tax=Amniculicola lignicola CBS 123094 TaxID=1392246 RepID=A0A6A5W3X5_9PLEO|nr:HET-domain-containing protein [Amniculicola lignicola CBS 123094]